MKNIFKNIIWVALFAIGCTGDFDEINTNPNAIRGEDASAKYFITNPQYQLYAPDRFPYWRAHLIHADRFAGQFTFGFHNCWWSDELGYSYSSSYTDASWGWLDGYFSGLDNFMRLTKPGGEFENDKMYAVGQIMRGLYFQMFTDIFGEIPYSETGNPDIDLPAFDTQSQIYQGLISELDEAMTTIGSELKTGGGVEDLGINDLYFEGDLQGWKKLANSLKLRLATRALNSGEGWAQTAIDEALADPTGFLAEDESVLMEKDAQISQWGSSAYADIYYNFGAGSDWNVSEVVVNYLQENNDPRLEKYAKPAEGGTFRFRAADDPDGVDAFWTKINYLHDGIDRATGGNFTYIPYALDSVDIEITTNTYYIGQPVRLSGKIKTYARHEFYSNPAEIIIQKKNEGKPIFPEIVFTSAEAFFLQAQAALNGGPGNANDLYQSGLTEAMKIWGVDQADIDDFLNNSPMGSLTGTTQEQLEQVAIQRWLAAYTDGFEAWAIVRETGYPTELSTGVSDPLLHGLGDINGQYPQRMKYGNNAYNTNGDNLNVALGRQGPDAQDVKLWWAK